MHMRLMLLGGGNALGQALIRQGAEEDIGFLAPRPPDSGWDAASLTQLIDDTRPDALINLAYYHDWFQAETASEARFAILLLGFGLREFSVGPQSIPELRTILSRLTVAEAEQLSEQVMKMGQCGEIDRVLEDAAEKFLPRAEFGE